MIVRARYRCSTHRGVLVRIHAKHALARLTLPQLLHAAATVTVLAEVRQTKRTLSGSGRTYVRKTDVTNSTYWSIGLPDS